MAVQWGDWEDSGGNGMRVGLDISWGTPTHGSAFVDCTVEIHTENRFAYSDSQQVNYSGHLDDNTASRANKAFTNSQAGGVDSTRDTVTVRYTYGGSEYGSIPTTKTFTATLSGAFNGVTPSVSKNSNVPARPYAAPAVPTSGSVTRLSDTQQRVNWVNNATAGEPYTDLGIERGVAGGGFSALATVGVTTQYTDSTTVANQKYQYRVRSHNSVAYSTGYTTTGFVWTSPGTPTINTVLTPVVGPTGQRIQWTNTTSYTEYETVVVAYKDGVDQGAVGVVAAGTTQFDHTTANGVSAYTASNKWKYYTYARTTTGATVYSGASSWTAETPGTTYPPLAPTNLAPNGSTVDPTIIQNLTWTHNPQSPDVSAQTKYTIQHRLQGAGSWTTTIGPITSGTSSYAMPANTYSSGQSMEWQVATYGTNPGQGAWSASGLVQFTSALAKLPVFADLYTGELEMSTTAYIARYALAATIVAATTPNALPPASSVQFLTAAESTSGGWPWGAVAGFLRTETFISGGTKYASQEWLPVDGTNTKNFRTGSATTWSAWWDTGWLAIGGGVAPNFTGTWANYGSGFTPAAIRKVGDNVSIRGLVATGTINSSVFTLAVGWRPSTTTMLTGIAAGHAVTATVDAGTFSGGTNLVPHNTGAATGGVTAHTHPVPSHQHSIAGAGTSGTIGDIGNRIDVGTTGTVTPGSTNSSAYLWIGGTFSVV